MWRTEYQLEYKGSWENSEKSGFGTYYYHRDGCITQGMSVEDELQGEGKLILEDGTIREGFF